jgi:mono/diheme cytochrome c family protein
MAEKKKSRIKRFALMGVLAVLGFGVVSFGTLHFVSASKLKATVVRDAKDIHIPTGDPDAIERGRYLVSHVMVCGDCHGEDMGGMAPVDKQPMGRIYAPNITTGMGSVVGDYTGKDWDRAIRHGVGIDGRRLLLMPSEDYYLFSDADIGAAVAYIQSLPPVDRENKSISLGPIGKLIVATGELDFAYNKIDHDAGRPDAQPGPTKEWGEVMIGACIGCHGPTLSGGAIPGGDPSWPVASNLTPAQDGLAGWTYEDFVRAMREGKSRDGSDIREPMPWPAYRGMVDDDLKALWAYIKSAPEKPFGNR